MSIIMNKALPDGGTAPRGAGGQARCRIRCIIARNHPRQETPMRILTFLLIPALPVALAMAGCATPQTREQAYEQALSQWQGATEDSLRARWGRPVAEEQIGAGKWLTYVVNNGAVPPPTMSFSIGGFGFGGGHT